MFRVLGSALVVGLLLGTGCRSSAPLQDHPEYEKLQGEVEQIINAVRVNSGPQVMVSLERLIAYDVFAVDQLLDLAHDPSARLRSNALWVLAQINDPNYPAVQKQIHRALREALDDRDRLVRLEAANGLLARNDWESIPMVIAGLEDDDPVVRFECHETLRQVTSQDFGYRADAAPEQRQVAVARWKEWYSGWAATEG